MNRRKRRVGRRIDGDGSGGRDRGDGTARRQTRRLENSGNSGVLKLE